MAAAAYIVFKQNTDGSWESITPEAVQAVTADAAIEAARTTAGTFVAVLARGLRPRTHYTSPRDTAKPNAAKGGELT